MLAGTGQDWDQYMPFSVLFKHDTIVQACTATRLQVNVVDGCHSFRVPKTNHSGFPCTTALHEVWEVRTAHSTPNDPITPALWAAVAPQMAEPSPEYLSARHTAVTVHGIGSG